MQNRNIKYLVSFMVSILLLVIAIMGPQLLFGLQDKYWMEKSWQGQRVSLDIEALNSSYGGMRERLTGFADGLAQGKNYYVAGTEYKVTEDTFGLVEQILRQEIFAFLWEWGMMPYPIEKLSGYGYSIENCKKYVVYDDTFDEGKTSIVVMAWYLELKISDDFRIKMLTDTETNALYYIQYVMEENDIKENVMEKTTYSEIENLEMWYYREAIELLLAYCYYYYEAGVEKSQSYDEFIMAFEKGKDAGSILQGVYLDEGVSAKLKLPYGDNGNFLILDMGAKYVDDSRKEENFYMGIMEIKEIIPELQ